MTPRRRRIAGAAALGVVLALGYASYVGLYAGPRDRIAAKLAEDNDAIARYSGALQQEAAVDRALRDLGARTLGGTPEQADAALRDTLFAVADRCGLRAIEVTTTSPGPVHNPVGDAGLRTPLGRDLGKQVDFRAFSGTLTGQGTLDAVLRAAATLDAQPWAHRVVNFVLKPIDKEREQFEIQLTVETILAPDLAGQARPFEVGLLGDAAAQKWAALVQKNVFRVPPPSVREAAPPAPKPPAAPQSPYAGWRITGVVESRLGTEVWLVNERSKEHLALPVGGVLADAKLLSGSGERAVFEIEGKKFEVASGQTLDERRPLN